MKNGVFPQLCKRLPKGLWGVDLWSQIQTLGRTWSLLRDTLSRLHLLDHGPNKNKLGNLADDFELPYLPNMPIFMDCEEKKGLCDDFPKNMAFKSGIFSSKTEVDPGTSDGSLMG